MSLARTMILRVGPGMRNDTKEAILSRWYRDQIKEAVPSLIAKWEPIVGVSVRRVFVRQMKTKWGSCNPEIGLRVTFATGSSNMGICRLSAAG